MRNTVVKDSVQECVDYALQSKQTTDAVFAFVHKLIEERGWTEVDAREVGARALLVLDNARTSKPK